MTDRELLELAAKAAGIELHIVANENGSIGFFQYPSLLYWNPLEDDGDALRLAVRLHFDIIGDFAEVEGKRAVSVSYPTADDWEALTEWFTHGDPYSATRRAIVRAAAEIGKGMK